MQEQGKADGDEEWNAAWKEYKQAIAQAWEEIKQKAAPHYGDAEWLQVEQNAWERMSRRLRWEEELHAKQRQEQEHIAYLRSMEKTYQAFQQWLDEWQPIRRSAQAPAKQQIWQQQSDPHSLLMTGEEVKATLRCSGSTLWRYKRDGKLVPWRGKWYRRSDVDALLKRREVYDDA